LSAPDALLAHPFDLASDSLVELCVNGPPSASSAERRNLDVDAVEKNVSGARTPER
jgi:hypothetical protein